MNQLVINMKQGDLLPSITHPCTLAGAPVNLTSATIAFRFRSQAGGMVHTGAGVVLDPPEAGIVKYDWQTGDTDVPGVYNAEFVATIAGKEISFPNAGYFRLEIAAGLEP